MKKNDLKKMALMGITGGILISQAAIADESQIPGYQNLLAQSCGGFGSCSGGGASYDNGSYYQGYQGGHSCSGSEGYYPSQGYSTGHSCRTPPSSGSYSTQGYSGGGCSTAPQGGYSSCSTMPQGGYTSQGYNTMPQGGSYYQSGGQYGNTSGTYYNNPNTTQGNQPGSSYRSSKNAQDWNNPQNRDNSTPPTSDMPQQMMPQGTSTPQKTSYNYTRSRSYTAQNDPTTRPGSATVILITEDELTSQLNDQGKAMYKSLSPEGKNLALKLASQDCKGHNSCKGMGSCKSDKNSCAGQNACSGQSSCKFKDKNVAVKVAAKKMAEKRATMNNN